MREAFAKAGIAPPKDTTQPAEAAGEEVATDAPPSRADGAVAARSDPAAGEAGEARPDLGLRRERRASAPIPKVQPPHRGRIGISEIVPGIVVRLDPDVLIASGQICNTQDPPVTRSGLFVCVAAQERASTWAGITTAHRRERLEIKPEWRRGGRVQWRRGLQYLTDGASLWHGDDRAFVAASWEEISFAISRSRAFLSEEGLSAVLAEVDAQRHRRHRSWEP